MIRDNTSYSSARDIITVKNDLKRIARDLEVHSAEYAVARKRVGTLAVQLEIEYAKKYSQTDTSMKIDDRKSLGILQTEELRTALAVAEAEADVLKQSMKVLESVLNSTQTLASLLKSEEIASRGFSKL